MTRAGPLRIGLVGCGRIAEFGYAPAIAGGDGIELAAVADPVADRARLVAHASGARPSLSSDAAELVASSQLDAVIVASPVDRHVTDAERVAAAGLPCLVEKPPAPDAAGAGALARLRPAPWIGFNRRFQHASDVIDRVPATGALEIEAEISYRRATWRPHGDLGDALADLGPHLVDLALLVSGSREAEVARAEVAERSAEVELATGRGRAVLRCATDSPHRERLAVRRPGEPPLATAGSGGFRANVVARLRRREHPLVSSLRRQLEAFAAAIRGAGNGLLATADDGERVMRVIDAARERA